MAENLVYLPTFQYEYDPVVHRSPVQTSVAAGPGQCDASFAPGDSGCICATNCCARDDGAPPTVGGTSRSAFRGIAARGEPVEFCGGGAAARALATWSLPRRTWYFWFDLAKARTCPCPWQPSR